MRNIPRSLFVLLAWTTVAPLVMADVIPFFGSGRQQEEEAEEKAKAVPPPPESKRVHDTCAPSDMKEGAACARDEGPGVCRWVSDPPGVPEALEPDFRTDARCKKEDRCLMCVDKRTVYDVKERLAKAKKALAAGKVKDAFDELDAVRGVSRVEECQRTFQLARAAAALGKPETALSLNTQAAEIAEHTDGDACPNVRETTYNRACYQAAEDPAGARETLSELANELAGGRSSAKVWKHYEKLLNEDKELAPLRKLPWFAKVKARFEAGASAPRRP